jgi:hypothetical protein
VSQLIREFVQARHASQAHLVPDPKGSLVAFWTGLVDNIGQLSEPCSPKKIEVSTKSRGTWNFNYYTPIFVEYF